MNTNDPKLTAYALGELEGDERATVEAEVSRSDTLRDAVEQIRETARLLETALSTEEAPHLSDEQRAQIEREAQTMTTTNAPSQGVIFSFVRRHWFITSAAATVALALGLSYLTIPELLSQNGFIPGNGSSLFANVNKEVPSIFEMKNEQPIAPPNSTLPVKNVDRHDVERIIDKLESPAPGVAVALRNKKDAAPGGPLPAENMQVVMKEGARPSRNEFSGAQHIRISQDPNALTSQFGAMLDARVPSTETSQLTVYNSKYRAASDLDAVLRSFISASRGARLGEEDRQMLDRLSSAVGKSEYDRISPGDIERLRSLGYVGEELNYADPLHNTESYDRIIENPFLLVIQDPLSTFSIDVDTASYANVRRYLNSGSMPPPGAVRIEEMINYFNYDYPQPAGADPFSVNVEVAECPWHPDHRLARIGLKGYEVSADERPPANLVFLIDVSGSMQSQNKLPLLKQAMKMLVNQLTPDDDVAIAVYAGASGLVLSPTPCGSPGAIHSALDAMQAGGSTNGAAGIQLAYETAINNLIPGGVNRVILATDGDFNVGATSRDQLIRMVEEKANSGVFLSVLGFGMGNLKDSTLEQLADKGNGNYAYIDTIQEAQKVLVDEIGGTLFTIAKDVKIQIEFNPAVVSAYRLIGYENRMLAAQDFNDDKKDAGEIGAGHTVTALYEIVPVGVETDVPSVDPLKYQTAPSTPETSGSGEMMTVKLRYKEPDGDTSKLIEVPVIDTGAVLAESSDDFALAASVAGFGMLLRSSTQSGDFTYRAVMELASSALGDDPNGYRAEFLQLVSKAENLSASQR